MINLQAVAFRLCRIVVALCATLLVGACAISIVEPADNSVVGTPTKITITGNASYSNLKVLANGIDVTGNMVYQGGNRHEGSITVPPGRNLLEASAEVYCWYCTGLSTPSADRRWFNVLSDHAFIDIEAGEAHTCAVDSANKAFCWGDNSFGQLGTGTVPDLLCSLNPNEPQRPCRPNPAEVAGNIAFRMLSAGSTHTCGLAANGDVFCWGRNNRGQLGQGTVTDSRIPLRVVHAAAFKAISVGDEHSCAIDVSGELYCWGDNGRGQLGVIGGNSCPVGTSTGCSPVAVRQGTGIPGGSFLFQELSAGGRHTCASNLETIKCWGDNTEGQLGIGTIGAGTGGASANLSVYGQFVTYAIPAGTTMGPGLNAGAAHTCGLPKTGSSAINCWGSNFFGQLGGSWPTGSSFPNPMPSYTQSGYLMIGISAGGQHSCALMRSPAGNSVPVCSGLNADGQLGNASLISTSGFVKVSLQSPTQDFFKITVGARHSCALNTTGRLTTTAGGTDYFGAAFCWGDNTYGQIGQNYEQRWTSPTEVHFP